MDNKKILFGNDSRSKLKEGIDGVANAVKATLGYGGRVVVISNTGFPARSTKDGVTVANSIKFKDEEVDAGAKIIKEASSQTADDVGDGTTTVCVLMQKIVEEGIKAIGTGANAVLIKKGIEYAVKKVVDIIDGMKVEATKEMLYNVATVSANNDNEIGKMIGDVYMDLDKHAIITLEDSKSPLTYVDYVQGFQFNSGYFSHHFVNNYSNNNCELDNPYVLILEGKINDYSQIAAIANRVALQQRALLIIAEDFDRSVPATLIKNFSVLKSCIVKYNFTGETKQELMYDIAAVTGGTIAESKGDRIETIGVDYLGECERVVISKDETLLIRGRKSEDLLKARIKDASTKIEKAKNPFQKQQQEKRFARLSGKIAVCYVGGSTEVEINEKKDRIDDSIRATKAAMEDGVVPGGGTALLRCVNRIMIDASRMDIPDDVRWGIKIVGTAIQSPASTIMLNAIGSTDHLKEVMNAMDNFGYNVATDTVCDMFEAGILDPAKVVKLCLQNAASSACQVLISEVLIVSDNN